MNTLKNLGLGALGLFIPIALVVGAVLLIALGTRIAFAIQPIVDGISAFVVLVDIVLLPLLFIRRTRSMTGVAYMVSSFVFGLDAWLVGLAITFSYWGLFWVVVGTLFMGVGVVPLGLLAAAVHGQWGLFGSLLLSLVLTFGMRALGSWAIESTVNQGRPEQGRVSAQTDFPGEDERTNEMPQATASLDLTNWRDQELERLYSFALHAVYECGKASPALLEHRLHISYGWGARLIERMENEGLVGPADKSRPRTVNMARLKRVLEVTRPNDLA